MYLRTPKRYRRQRRQLRLFSARALVTLLVIPVIAAVGWYLWDNQEQVRSEVMPELEGIRDTVQTQVASEPTPSPTPDLMAAQSGCLSAYQQGHMEEAVEQCRLLAEGRPNDVDLHYRVAYLMVITSGLGSDPVRLDEALAFAEKTINANPELPHGWAIRALVLDWKGDVGRALASALQAKAIDDQFAPTYAFLGEIYHDLEQEEVALSYLDQALELDTGGLAVAYTFRTRGKVFSDQGYYEDAIQPYQAALQNAPNESYIAVELANNYLALQENDRAIAVLNSTLEGNPDDTLALLTLGWAYLRNGNPERASEYYHRCLDADPDNIRCLSFLGGLQWMDGDLATAIVNLERAIQLGSTDPEDFYQLGQSHASLGRCDLAVPYLQQGYQIAVADGKGNWAEAITTTLQSCDVMVPAPAPSATPTQ
jgi:tetratricopeptide (TPR) repeat protein